MNPALKMFDNLLDDTSQFEDCTETSWSSVGHYLRTKVRYDFRCSW